MLEITDSSKVHWCRNVLTAQVYKSVFQFKHFELNKNVSLNKGKQNSKLYILKLLFNS